MIFRKGSAATVVLILSDPAAPSSLCPQTWMGERLAPPQTASQSQAGDKRWPPSWTAGVLQLLSSVCEDLLSLPGRKQGGSFHVTPVTPDARLLTADHEPAPPAPLYVSVQRVCPCPSSARLHQVLSGHSHYIPSHLALTSIRRPLFRLLLHIMTGVGRQSRSQHAPHVHPRVCVCVRYYHVHVNTVGNTAEQRYRPPVSELALKLELSHRQLSCPPVLSTVPCPPAPPPHTHTHSVLAFST